MKYIAQISYKHRVVDELILETNDRDKAIKAAEKALARLTNTEIKDLAFLQVIEIANPDQDADDHLDGEVIWNYEDYI